MAGRITNCAQFRKWMADAADAALAGNLRAGFDAHLRDCAACRQEFGRMQTLLQAINSDLSASVAAEPSPQFVARIRQRIAEQPQPHRAPLWLPGNAWLTAAGACAALAVFLLAARASHKSPELPHADVAGPVASPPAHIAPLPNPRPSGSVASVPSRPPGFVAARTPSSRAIDRPVPEPEVIVEPGQMQAIFRFAAAMQSGQVDGAKLLADEKKSAAPLVIKPIPVAPPLNVTALNDDATPAASGPGESGDKKSVTGCSD